MLTSQFKISVSLTIVGMFDRHDERVHLALMQGALGVRFSPASITRIELLGSRAELLSLNEVNHLFI